MLQADGGQRQNAAVLPPAVVGRQIGARVILGKQIGTAACGGGAVLGACFDDGNVQAAGQCGQRGGQGDDHRVLPDVHGGHVPQPGGIALRGAGALQRGGHVGRRDGGAVREGRIGLDADGPGALGGIICPAVRQDSLGPELLVQGEQPLVQQGLYGLLHSVRGADGVEGAAGDIGQGKGGQRLRLRFFVFILIEVGQLSQGVLGDLPVGAAGGQQHGQRQQQAQQCTFHSVSSRRAISAACSPRRRPIFRWLQYRSGRQAVQ